MGSNGDITLERGKLYKLKETPEYDDDYTIICPKYDKTIKLGLTEIIVKCIFKVKGRGRKRTLVADKQMSCISLVHNGYSVFSNSKIKQLKQCEYIIVGQTLKRYGYMYDKRTKKLVAIKNEIRKK